MKPIHHIRLIVLEVALLIFIVVLLHRHFQHHWIEQREQPGFTVVSNNVTYRINFALRDDGQVTWSFSSPQ